MYWLKERKFTQEEIAAFFQAVHWDDVKTIKAFLAQGMPVDVKEKLKFSDTPLIRAAMEGQNKALKVLINAGADLETKESINGNTALIMAVCAEGDVQTVRLLIDAGADVTVRVDGKVPLKDYAVSDGRNAIADLIQDRLNELEDEEMKKNSYFFSD